jgi:hypothetical protein
MSLLGYDSQNMLLFTEAYALISSQCSIYLVKWVYQKVAYTVLPLSTYPMLENVGHIAEKF